MTTPILVVSENVITFTNLVNNDLLIRQTSHFLLFSMINKFIAFSSNQTIFSFILIYIFFGQEATDIVYMCETSQTCWFTHGHSLQNYFQLRFACFPFSDKIWNEFLMTYFCNYIFCSFLLAIMHFIFINANKNEFY